MRAIGLALLFSLAAACGRSGNDPGLGAVNEGIESNPVGPNGCVEPSSVTWTDERDALEHGTTGDTCTFEGGGAGDGTAIDTCVAHRLYIETFVSADQSFCITDGGGFPESKVLDGGCVESCHNSGGAVISCIKQPVRPPSRQIANAWSLNAQSDCDALFSGCPETGDPCTGGEVCTGYWHPGMPITATELTLWWGAMWCANGSLVVGEADF